MTTMPPRGNDVSGRMLALAFAAVVASFFASTFVVQRSSSHVNALASSIIDNVSPSIEHLAQVRRAALEAELSLAHVVHEPASRDASGADLEAQVARLRQSTDAYLQLPAVSGEQPLREHVRQSWLHFESTIREAQRLAQGAVGGDAAERALRRVERARQELLEAVTSAIEHDAVHGRELAAQIRESRLHTNRLARGLNVLCGALAAALAWLLHRQARARRVLFDRHAASLRERAAELEQFAGRVAHDIRNPLSAARMGAELALRRSPGGPGRPPIEAVIRSLSRADAITNALLDFARAGAQPDPGARASPRQAVADTLDGFHAEAERTGIALKSEPAPPVLVACGPGVYLSLLGNLVRNAMKYMGEQPVREVSVRVVERGEAVRTEVRDTGPGIAPELLPSLFEPYFRGQTGRAEGLGLGLATVKKLAEGHGGRVGVTSELGRGSTFWFELPRAGVLHDGAEWVESPADEPGAAATAHPHGDA